MEKANELNVVVHDTDDSNMKAPDKWCSFILKLDGGTVLDSNLRKQINNNFKV